ncbi:MAG: hypothetical protein QXP66_00995 [Candidatus Aenigmatarchaeota archaeon]
MIDYERVATYISDLYLKHNIDPNKTLSDLSKRSSFTEEQLKRIAEKTNQLIYTKLYETDKNKVIEFPVVDAKRAINSEELRKAAESLIIIEKTNNHGQSAPDYKISRLVERKTAELRLKQLKDDLHSDIISSAFRINSEIPKIAEQAVDIMLSKQANLIEIYQIIKNEVPKALIPLMNNIKSRLEDPIIKIAFNEDPFEINISSPRVKFVNGNNSFVMRLRWLNNELTKLEDTLKTYDSISTKLE